MKILPLKSKYGLTEEDINLLSAWMIDGRSLEEICNHFQDKMNLEQIFIACGIISREMYESKLEDLCPDLVSERRSLNVDRYHEWQIQKSHQRLMSSLREVIEDLSLFELEMQTRIKS